MGTQCIYICLGIQAKISVDLAVIKGFSPSGEVDHELPNSLKSSEVESLNHKRRELPSEIEICNELFFNLYINKRNIFIKL